MSTTDLDFDAGRDVDPETRSALSSYHSTYSALNSREQLRSRELLNSQQAMLRSRGEDRHGLHGTSRPSNGDQRTLDRLQGVLDPRQAICWRPCLPCRAHLLAMHTLQFRICPGQSRL